MAGAQGVLPQTRTTAFTVEITREFQSSWSFLESGLRGSSAPVLSSNRNNAAYAARETSIVSGRLPHCAPRGVCSSSGSVSAIEPAHSCPADPKYKQKKVLPKLELTRGEFTLSKTLGQNSPCASDRIQWLSHVTPLP